MQRAIQRVLCPEPEVLWAPFAIRKARDIIREFGIQTLMITAPPFSAFLVGNALKREFPHLQLISDFRDEWLDFYLNDIDFQGGEYTKKRASQMERETVELSDCIVAVTPSSLERIRRRYPDQPDDKFACVYNGFDPDTFQGFTRQPHGLPKVVVTHLGTAYKTASPRYYLDALDEMPEPMRSAIETRFIGRATDAELAILRSSKSPVDVIGFLPQAEALRRVEETDYLLLTMTNDISLPGKLFEYLAVGKPILALCSRGSETERILKLTQAGVTAEHTDRQAIQNMLAKAYESAMKGVPLCRGDRSEISKFERPRLAAQYGLLIQGLLERDRRPGREAAHQRTC
ncbi:MAG TPA: glycosyltransferase [Bryobacteraceae bacterium]|nr:glycosyltransferase [Bryobacteraceae bacterium]